MGARLSSLRFSWPAVGAAAALLLVTLAAVGSGSRHTGGRLVYPIDDPYIHMTIGRNLALHGSWGITPGHFGPASSSPLWTLLLAATHRLVGGRDATPLVLNLMFGVLIAFALERMLRPFIARGLLRGAVVLAVGLSIPLPAVIASGMEAPLHVALALTLAWAVATRLAADGPASHEGVIAIGALAALCELARFESVFLIGALAAIAIQRRRPGTACALIVGAALPLAAYMAFALPRGGLWLPNSVLLKTALAQITSAADWETFLLRIPDKLVWKRNSHMTVLLLAATWLLLPRPHVPAHRALVPRILLLAFVPATLLHIQLADLGWFFRYEAYLVALGLSAVVASVACGLHTLPGRWGGRRVPVPARIVATLAVAVLATPLVTRAVRSASWIAPAMLNIYEQQDQMARFVRTYFSGREVAINDLGAVGYYGGARVEDLLGLGTTPIARARLARRFDTAFIERFCAAQGVEVALLYTSFFEGESRLPSSWREVARWTVRNPVTVGDPTVSILATLPGSTTRVREAARAFAPTLPPGVHMELLD